VRLGLLKRVVPLAMLALAVGAPAALAATGPFTPGVVLVGFRPGVTVGQRYAIERAAGGDGSRRLGPAIRATGHGRVRSQEYLEPLALRVPNTQVLAVVRRLKRDRAVAYAEPDYLMQADAIVPKTVVMPNDPSFALQWGSDNIGQSIPFQSSEEVLGASTPGTPGDDDGAARAWQVSTGSRSIVIGEVDTGVEYTHPDLAANIWSNPGGIGGCAAGTHGYSVVSDTCNPMDTDTTYNGHGTHVAGIMGAVGNNGIGVAGINWQTTILPVKWLNSASSGSTSSLIEALQWLLAAKQAGVNVRVVNDSAVFYGTASSQALSNEIDTLGANGILFVTAAGNSGDDNDNLSVRRYPCGYDRPTEICVTASNDHDELPSWANYGPNTVNLAAPGASIYSTLRGDKYGYLSGGSMASPQVTGAAALILSVKPTLSPAELKADIVDNVQTVPALSGKVISGGVLDVCKALPGCESQASAGSRPAWITPPTITGTAQSGQTLSANPGTWSESPYAYGYQWLRCNPGCSNITGETGQTYTLASADVGSTIRVLVTATNSVGTSEGAYTQPSAVVVAGAATFGKTNVGANSQADPANLKGVSKYALPTAGSVSKLSLYLQPTGSSGQQSFRGVVYAESNGAPGALLGSTNPLTVSSTSAAGWYELPFAAALKLAAGNYWIGFISGTTSEIFAFRYDTVSSALDYNTNTFTTGASNPFGTPTTLSYEISLYASYTAE